MDKLQTAAKQAAEALGNLEGVKETSDGLQNATPALHIRVDRNKAMENGITVAQVYMELAAAMQSSTTVTTLHIEGKDTQVIVEKPKDSVLTAADLEDFDFSVTTQTGEKKNLS